MNKPSNQRVYFGIDVDIGSARAGIFTGAGVLLSMAFFCIVPLL